MLKKRVIPVLLLCDGRMVKGKQFSNFRDTGDPRTAVRIYSA
jgi:cyclase